MFSLPARLLGLPNLYGLVTVACWLVALALAVWIVAGRIWEGAAPAPIALSAAPLSDAATAAQSVAARHLMGESVNVATVTAAPPPPQYRLLGAMTASGRMRGFAILAQEGKPAFPVVEGEEIAPGLKLFKVLPDQVVLEQGDRKEKLLMANIVETPGSIARGVASARPVPAPAAAAAAAKRPEGQRP